MGTDFYKKLEEERQKQEKMIVPPAEPFSMAPKIVPTGLHCLNPGDAMIGLPTSEDPAVKYDQDKPRYDLIPPEALDGLAHLYGMGAGKYEDRNWEKGMRWSRQFAAMMRHAWKWWRGEEYDQENGQHHLLSVMFCAMALYTYFVRRSGTDDRPPQVTPAASYDAVWRVAPEAASPKALN